MKATYQISQLPQSGVMVTTEGALLRLLFDFTHLETEGDAEPSDLYNCESVDVAGRGYGDIVSAIVNDRYSADEVQAVMANYAEAVDAGSSITEEKRAEYLGEYAGYQAWRRHAKEIAARVLSSHD